MKIVPFVFAIPVWLLAFANAQEPPKNLRGGHQQHRVLSRGPNGVASIVHGNLASLGLPVTSENIPALQNAAAGAAKSIAEGTLGVATFDFVPSPGKPPQARSNDGSLHVRLMNSFQGLLVEGAAVVVHIAKDGTVTGMNGEIVSGTISTGTGQLPPGTALEMALEKAGLTGTSGEWVSGPKLTAVRTNTGAACKAWKGSYFWEATNDDGFLTPHREDIYAEVSSGYVSDCFLFVLLTSLTH